MSPEQVRGGVADHRSDIFSFGVVLYEMLTGARPFRGDSAVETMNAILTQDPPPLVVSDQVLAPALAAIVDHCLEKEPGGAIPVGARPGLQPRGAARAYRAGRCARRRGPASRVARRALSAGLAGGALLAAGAFIGARWRTPVPARRCRSRA